MVRITGVAFAIFLGIIIFYSYVISPRLVSIVTNKTVYQTPEIIEVQITNKNPFSILYLESRCGSRSYLADLNNKPVPYKRLSGRSACPPYYGPERPSVLKSNQTIKINEPTLAHNPGKYRFNFEYWFRFMGITLGERKIIPPINVYSEKIEVKFKTYSP